MASQRLQYIDALRGIAIFIVVYSHILIFCMPPYPESFIVKFLRLFYLNGFFFISGYLFYKPIETFTRRKLKDILFKKTTMILIPTLVVGSVYWYSHGIEMLIAIFDEAKMGYWFTFVLYEMFLVLTVLMWIFNQFKVKKIIELSILLILFLTSFVIFRFFELRSDLLGLISAFNFMFYLPIFVLGMLCKLYNPYFNKILNSRICLAVTFLLVFVSFIIKIPSFITSIAIVILAFAVCHKIEDSTPVFFEKGCGKYLSLFGTFSMEIYFLHYFLLFEVPQSLSSYLTELSTSHRSVSFPEFLIVGTIAACICIGSIAIAKFIHYIPYIRNLALGK